MSRRTDIQSGSDKGRGAIPLGLFALHPLRSYIDPVLFLPLKDGTDLAAIEMAADRIFRCCCESHELDLPKSKPSRSQRAAKAEAQRFFKLAQSLWTHMRSMHRDSRAAVARSTRSSPGLAPMLSGLSIDDYERATAGLTMGAFLALEDFPNIPDYSQHPNKAAAAEVADCCAIQFEKLTGRRPTIVVDAESGKAGGQFLDFLRRVYEASEISASPEAMGRAAIARMKKQKGPAILRIDPATMEKKPKKSPK